MANIYTIQCDRIGIIFLNLQVRKQAQGHTVTSWGFWFREAGSSLETAPALQTDLPALVTYLRGATAL